MMKRIGVFGGSFDPVHKGHIALADAAVKELKLDKLIIMPAYIQPFKKDRETTEAGIRLEMLRLAFHKNPEIEVSDYEIMSGGISYTVNTLAHIKEQYPDCEIIFVMGTDSFISFSNWYEGKTMLRNYSLAVSERPGYKEDELHMKMDEYRLFYKTTVYGIKAEMPDCSSTEIRDFVKEGRLSEAGDMLDDAVIQFILENKLYTEG